MGSPLKSSATAFSQERNSPDHIPVSDAIESLLTAMPTILDLPCNCLDTCIIRNLYAVIVVILYLEREAPEVRGVATLSEELPGSIVPFHGVAGVLQPVDGDIMIAPVLACLEAFCGCRGRIHCGDNSKDFGDLHVDGEKTDCG